MKRKINISIGEKIKSYRESKEFTQDQLSYESGVGQKTISYIENNERLPGLDTVYKLALAMKLDTLEICTLLVSCLLSFLENLRTLRHK